MFEEALEEARPVYRVTRADLMVFKRALAETPSNYTKRFHGMKLPDAIRANKARATPFPPLHSKTINGKYLAKLHSLLNWCVRNDILPDNPATGVKVAAVKDKGKPPRVPFTPDDLSRIFDPDFFKAPKVDSEAEWAALISLFSGLRASELAQLKLDSVRHNQNILVFEVEEETKNAGSLRVVPVHSFLIGRGIEKLVADLRRKKETHLFPQWYRDGMETKAKALKKGESTLNHYFPRFIPRRFNNTYLPNVGVQDSRKKWHSFRHTFKTGLSRAGVVRSVRDDICGHVDNSAGAGYVHETSVAVMKDAIEKLKFDGFPLDLTRRAEAA
jgi:integrase